MATMPPTLPDPDALAQTMLGSTGSGVDQPLSPPAIVCHMARGMAPPSRLLLGPRYDGPSCLLPYTLYGTTVLSGVVCIEWWVRQPITHPRPPAREGERHAGVVGDDHPFWIRRIDPHV